MTARRRDLLRHLEQAADAFGGDLPLGRARERERKTVTGTGDGDGTERGEAGARAQGGARGDELAALRAEVLGCVRCKLCHGRKNVVFGEGNARARVLFVGEAPGQTEDETGRPFVGRAGQLLTRIIENAMGLAREDVYIANINKCRPPDNRVPEPDEVAACLPYLREQIRLIRPEVIVCLGKTAVSNLLGDMRSVGKLRGLPLEFASTPVVVTWHPAYLLRNPAAKQDTWQDIRRVNLMLGLPEIPRAAAPPPPTGDAARPTSEDAGAKS